MAKRFVHRWAKTTKPSKKSNKINKLASLYSLPETKTTTTSTMKRFLRMKIKGKRKTLPWYNTWKWPSTTTTPTTTTSSATYTTQKMVKPTVWTMSSPVISEDGGNNVRKTAIYEPKVTSVPKKIRGALKTYPPNGYNVWVFRHTSIAIPDTTTMKKPKKDIKTAEIMKTNIRRDCFLLFFVFLFLFVFSFTSKYLKKRNTRNLTELDKQSEDSLMLNY